MAVKYMVGDIYKPIDPSRWNTFQIIKINSTTVEVVEFHRYNKKIFINIYHLSEISNWVQGYFTLDLDTMYRNELIQDMKETFDGLPRKD